MLTRRSWICLLAFTAADVAPALGQATAAVRGVVRAAGSGQPLAGTHVEVEGLGLAVRTDAQGHYRLDAIPAGRHTILFRRLGRVAQHRIVRLTPGEAVLEDVMLAAAPIRLQALRVVRRRTELAFDADAIPGSVHVIGAEAIDEQNLFHDVHQALRRLPGVNVREEEGFGLRPNIGLRGSGSERSAKITLMEDGVLIAPAPYAAPAAYYFPVVGRMAAVEVRKGSSQIRYGPRTVGGAVNLVSAPIPGEATLDLDLAGGANTTRRMSARAGDSYDRFGWMIQGYHLASDGFKDLDNGETGFGLHDFLAKVRFNSAPASRLYQELQLKAGYNRQRSDETYLGLTDADFARHPWSRYAASQMDVLDSDHRQLALRHFLRSANGAVDVTTTVYRHDFARNWFKLQSVGGRGIASVLSAPDRYGPELAVLRGEGSYPAELRVRANNREYFATGVQSVLGLAWGEAAQHELEVGVRWHRDEEDRLQHEDGFRMEAGRMVQTSAGAPGSQSNRVSAATAIAMFAQDRITIGDWTVTPGVRYEWMRFTRTDYATDAPSRLAAPSRRANTVNVLAPGIGVSYAMDGSTRIFAGVHRGFAPPGPGADDATEAERTLSYELGVRHRGRELRADVAAFYSDYANILGAATLSAGGDGSADQFNGGAADVWGLEASLRYDPPQGRRTLTFPLRVALTFTRAAFRTDFESHFAPWATVRAGDRLPYLAPVQLHASGGVRHQRWSANLGVDYSSAMRTSAGRGPAPASQRTDAFAVMNLSADYRLTAWSALYLGVQNLTDDAHIVARRPAGVRPGLPRTILGGVRIRR